MSRWRPKEKRRGGARDDTEIYIGHTREELLGMIMAIERKYGVRHNHAFSYKFRPSRPPFFDWRKYKKKIRKTIDAWQMELPLF